MARRKYDKALYDKLVKAYRESPNNHSMASRIAGVDRRTAQRAFELGWPRLSWAIPIKKYLQEEKAKIRAERQKQLERDRAEAELQRERSIKDAIKAQEQEAAATASARANALALANVIGRIVMGCIPLSERVAKSIKEDEKITPLQAMKIFSAAAYVVRQGGEAIRLAMEVERLRVGEPTDILKLQTDDMSQDDVASELSHLHRTLSRAMGRGLMVETLQQEMQAMVDGDDPQNADSDDEDDFLDDEDDDETVH